MYTLAPKLVALGQQFYMNNTNADAGKIPFKN